MRDVTTGSLRAQVGLVPQEATLFGGTVRENIRYGRLDATDDEVEAAARAANAHDFITRARDGLRRRRSATAGQRLSGGQRQRIAIARAILKDPPILLLDEATSALDNESERLVQEALDRLMQGRTTIIVAHRLSTIRAAHRIAVLDDGWLVELGTHDELLERTGSTRGCGGSSSPRGSWTANAGATCTARAGLRLGWRRRLTDGRDGQPNQVRVSSSDTLGIVRTDLMASGGIEVRRATRAAIRSGSWLQRRSAARSRRGHSARARRSK